ncbi:glutamyl-tRNA reductase [Corynebacterium qintianiae]|uniref:Glutamyl-tRNA reductase n=1 Tax=Corynebacterium qintianiae TaxID=2709392 RepID=A0A7T0KMH6_9CORY|nr:glutamyl-tRNA reductase [Corynebacterium qintianiae]QPK83468.1 glutamyl-tRNA reductase [Corynebacterium qintianiae]
MSVLVVGMSHRSAPVALLERLSMDDSVQTETTTALVSQPSLSEAMIISTCNRLEVYAVTNSFHSGVEDVLNVLAETSGVEEAELRSYLYVRYADAAAEHMMTVASGLDSMVVGEQQIIGQVRASYQDATYRGTVGPGLHSLAQSALHTGKRVHTETDIDDAGASMVTLALDEAMDIMDIDSFAGKTALVLGAGAMASLAATHLGKRGVNNLIIANRTRSRAERLAEHSREAGVPAEVVDFNARAGALARVDIAVSATASDEFTITAEDISGPVMLADLSLPRDIDDAVVERDGVHLVNIEYLHERMREGDSKDSRSRQAAEAIVAEEVSNFSSRQRVREVGPAVAQLRKAASAVTDGELERLRTRVPDLSEDDFEQVSRAVRRVVDKILHTPTVKIKELAATAETVSVETAIEELFGLGRSSVAIDAQRLPRLSEITDET